MKSYFALFVTVALLVACDTKSNDLPSLDLLSHGMPISINAPVGSEVVKSQIAFQQQLEIKGSDNFNLLVSSDDAVSSDPVKLKEEKLSGIKSHRYFFRLVEESDHGFIFENRIDSSNSSYGFNYIKVMGDREYVFENSRTGMFSLEEVQRMYKAVAETEE